MKKKYFLPNLIFICILILGCNSDDDQNITTTPQNQKPGDFTIQITQITENNALLSWNAAVDPDEDKVTYTVVLGDNEVQTNLETTEFLLEGLIAQTNYNGKVIASDGNGNTSENTFDFTTEEGEIINEEVSIAWEKSFGGSQIDVANAIQLTVDGGYIVAGTANSDDGDVGGNNDADGYLGGDYWVIKLNNSGDMIWETNLGGNSDEAGNSIQQTTDGGYIVVGFTDSNDQDISGDTSFADFWIVKLDGSGNLVWETNYGGSGNEEATSVDQTLDGGYIVAGFTSSSNDDVGGNNGGIDYWVIKLDAEGALIWETNLGGSEFDIAQSVEQTSDGGYIVGGYSESLGDDVGGNYGEKDYWIVKLDALGNLIWETNLGGSLDDLAYDIHQTTDQGYIVAGYSESSDFDVSDNNGKKDSWIVKLDTSGAIVWEVNLGSSESDAARSIQQTTDQGYIFAGNSGASDFDVSTNNGGYADYWVVKLNPLGELSWEISFGGPEPDYANAIQQTSDGYIVAGYVWGPGEDISGAGKGKWDYWIVKLE
ncbi:fibronectin type III domain-containing protein [Aquimarina algiphila]|uniref:Fibronectin type III domain-containing protein n=1 Tax=Aquimarina algiphila TaxID=2047982 RepID=A0A554VM94_9FLAO|nr:fibronectin type III domain-containing protein [Aquimarina algiphila]TSE09358.1 fibronectin type III domain-containing protein [Aquimarina algiphila]